MPAPYPQEQKTAAVELYAEVGPSEASRRLGIPANTIQDWACKAGVRTKVKRGDGARRVQAEAWEERREKLAHEIGEFAKTMLAKAQDAAEADDLRGAQTAAVTMGIAIDKAQLLTGGATNRVEHAGYEEREKEIRTLLDQKRALAAGAIRMDDHRPTGTSNP